MPCVIIFYQNYVFAGRSKLMMKQVNSNSNKNIVQNSGRHTLESVDVDINNYPFCILENVNFFIDKNSSNAKTTLNTFTLFAININSELNLDFINKILMNLKSVSIQVCTNDSREFKTIVYSFSYFDKSVFSYDLTCLTEYLKNTKITLRSGYYLDYFLEGETLRICLKDTFVNYLVNNEAIYWEKVKFEEKFIRNRLVKYIGCNLDNVFPISTNSKNKLSMQARSIIREDNLLYEFFKKSNLTLKCCLVNKEFKPKESISFPTFKFEEIVKEEWETSKLRLMFLNMKFLIFIFENHENNIIFKGTVEYEMPQDLLDNEVKDVWEKTKIIINSGNIVKNISLNKNGNPAFATNFPSMKENFYCHVRPHARNAQDSYPLPVSDKLTGQTTFTKQCFWLNAPYIGEIIKNGI